MSIAFEQKAPESCLRRRGWLRRTALLALLAPSLLLAACVSQVAPVLESAKTQHTASQPAAFQVAEPVAQQQPAPGPQQLASAPPPADPAPSADPALVATAAPQVPAAALPGAGAYPVAAPAGEIPVPVPAPRESRSAQGLALAFAPAAEEAQIIAGLPDAAGPGPAAAPARPQTTFEILSEKARAREQAAREAAGGETKVRTASLSGAAQGDPFALPGVKNTRELFGVFDEELDEGEPPEDVQVASLGAMIRMSPNGIRKQTDKVVVDCFPAELVRLLHKVEGHYGRPVVVTSGYRDAKHNRRAGGARKSTHIRCMAADIQVERVSKWELAKFLRTLPERGGVGTYCRTNSVHIDIGEERDWHYPCRRAKKKRRA